MKKSFIIFLLLCFQLNSFAIGTKNIEKNDVHYSNFLESIIDKIAPYGTVRRKQIYPHNKRTFILIADIHDSLFCSFNSYQVLKTIRQEVDTYLKNTERQNYAIPLLSEGFNGGEVALSKDAGDDESILENYKFWLSLSTESSIFMPPEQFVKPKDFIRIPIEDASLHQVNFQLQTELDKYRQGILEALKKIEVRNNRRKKAVYSKLLGQLEEIRMTYLHTNVQKYFFYINQLKTIKRPIVDAKRYPYVDLANQYSLYSENLKKFIAAINHLAQKIDFSIKFNFKDIEYATMQIIFEEAIPKILNTVYQQKLISVEEKQEMIKQSKYYLQNLSLFHPDTRAKMNEIISYNILLSYFELIYSQDLTMEQRKIVDLDYRLIYEKIFWSNRVADKKFLNKYKEKFMQYDDNFHLFLTIYKEWIDLKKLRILIQKQDMYQLQKTQEQYYNYVFRRDFSMIEHIKKVKDISYPDRDIIVAIVGGFHSYKISRRMDTDINYLEILPNYRNKKASKHLR